MPANPLLETDLCLEIRLPHLFMLLAHKKGGEGGEESCSFVSQIKPEDNDWMSLGCEGGHQIN